jgi:hypothetical protein
MQISNCWINRGRVSCITTYHKKHLFIEFPQVFNIYPKVVSGKVSCELFVWESYPIYMKGTIAMNGPNNGLPVLRKTH